MARFRRNLIIYTTLLFVFLFNLGGWYVDIDEELVTNVEKEDYLSHKEAEKAAAYYNPEQEYFYKIKYVELRQKTLIPFVYDYDTISPIKKQLMGRYRP